MILTFSLRASRLVFVKQSPFKQTKSYRGNFSAAKFFSEEYNELSEMISSGIKRSPLDLTRNEIYLTMKLIDNLNNQDVIDWEYVLKNLKEKKVQNPYSKVLQACSKLNKPNLGLDFHRYLVEKNDHLSTLDLMFFCKVLQQDKKEIQKFEDMLIELYKNVRETMKTSTVIRLRILNIFVGIPSLFSEIVKDARMSIRFANKPIVIKAFETNQPEIAYEFMYDCDFDLCNAFMEAFINYLINRAKDGTFSPEMITRFTDLCEQRCLKINFNFEPHLLKSLVLVLNKHHPNYVWSVAKSSIDNKSLICSNCNIALLHKSISKSECEKLKTHFWEKVLENQNVYLSSTKKELERFLDFLSTCKPFKLVIDGLNIYYIRKNTGTQIWGHYLNYFLEKGFDLLVIGKLHAQKHFTSDKYFKKKYVDKIQYFFVENVSNDDLFILYAALHRGLGTYIFSGDFLFNHSSNLDNDVKNLFQKWLLAHHYLLVPGSPPVPPMPHCNLSQLTRHSKKKYVWHLAKQNSKNRLSTIQPVEWFCLQATLKNFSDNIIGN